MISIIELFSGIGAIRKALIKQKIDHQVLFTSEINENAWSAYQTIFNDNSTQNFGDIKKISFQQLKPYIDQCDLLVFGSPCQDFSQGGNNKSGIKGSNTRSSLLWEAVRIIEIIKPKVIIFENVKNLIYKKHINILKEYLNHLSNLGYYNERPLRLNSLNFGIPQNRERIFTISSLNKIQNLNKINDFQIPLPSLKKFLKIKKFTERELCKETIEYSKWTNFSTWTSKNGKNINGSYNRAWKIDKYCGTLNVCNVIKITDGYNVSKLTPQEAFLLMGYSKYDFEKLSKLKLSLNQLHSLAGNSIVVNVLEQILATIYLKNELFKRTTNLKENQNKFRIYKQQTLNIGI